MRYFREKSYKSGIEKALSVLKEHIEECKKNGNCEAGYVLLNVYGELREELMAEKPSHLM